MSEAVGARDRTVPPGDDFRTIVEDTDSFIVRWSALDGRISWCNDHYAAFFEIDAQALVGTDIRTLLPDGRRESFFEQVRGIPAGETRRMSVLQERPDGRIHYTVGLTRAIADAAGHIVEYQATGQDLSDEYRYRKALEGLVGVDREAGHEADADHADLLRRILDIGLHYFELDSACLVRMTDEHCRVLAVSGEAAGSISHGDVLPRARTVCDLLPEDRTVLSFTHPERNGARGHGPIEVSGVKTFIGMRLRGVDGRRCAISFSSTVSRRRPFSVADESFLLLIGHSLSALLDERHRLMAIADENRYYQSLYLNVPVMMFLADERGRIIEISDRLVEQLGGAHENRVNAQAVELFGPTDAALAAGALLEGDCRDLAVTLALEGGRTLPCEMTCQLRDIGSLKNTRMCVLNDVSERNRAREDIEERNRRLAMANENLNQFAFIASHDLQEPLRKIQQFSSFLQEDHADRVDADGRYQLKVIVAAAERMSTLIKDLLEYSRTSRDATDPRRLSVRAVVEEVLDDLDLRVREADALVTLGELPVLSADPVLVRQLVANLIGNALKYRDGERRLELSIRQDVPGPRPGGIEFADNGIGFDPDQAARIFEPFTRLHTVQAYPGSGIGLAICAAVCDKHGWSLEADGEPGRGSTFRVRFGTDALAPDPDRG